MTARIKQIWDRFRAWQLDPFDYGFNATDSQHCSNCGNTFVGNYCPYCSQKAGLGRVSWQSVQQSVGEVWGMGNRSLSYSLLQLLLRPGHFIHDYISGKRQVSFPPVKMMLIVALVVSAAIQYWGSEDMSIAASLSKSDVTNSYIQFLLWADNNKGWGMLVALSMMVLPTWLLFRHAPGYSRHTLPEGFFIQVFLGILLVIFMALDSFGVQWALWLSVFYYLIAYHQLFGYGWWATTWRLVLCGYGALMMGITIGMMFEFQSRSDSKLTQLIIEMAVGALVMLVMTAVPLALGYAISCYAHRRRTHDNNPQNKAIEHDEEDSGGHTDASDGSADAGTEAASA